ncbi:MAG: PDZ domain-containing protein [Nitrospira sp.]|nr:PDZ domain-containing protein [Nitrospira sp.]
MWNRRMAVIAGMVFSFMMIGPLHAADQPGEGPPRTDEAKMPDGMIGISLHIGAERVGDPASLYVGRVRPEGPAHKAGLKHGDELVSVDGVAASGKTYEQVVRMVRGEAGTAVKLGIKRDGGLQEISITRVAGHQMKGPADHGVYKDKPKP